jgi:hypothetical protein
VKLSAPLAAYWPVYAVSAGIWLSGVLWLIFHYFLVRKTDFGPAPHPLEHWWLMAHGAMAFASLWLMGYLWATHIVRRWRLRRHRKTGGTLFATMMVLIVSGLLLYYPPSDDWHNVTAILHWVIGLAMPMALTAHWWIRAR